MRQPATPNVQICLFAYVTEIYEAVGPYIHVRTPADLQLIIADSDIPNALRAMRRASARACRGADISSHSVNDTEVLAYHPRVITG
jgi:hypothetical protein